MRPLSGANASRSRECGPCAMRRDAPVRWRDHAQGASRRDHSHDRGEVLGRKILFRRGQLDQGSLHGRYMPSQVSGLRCRFVRRRLNTDQRPRSRFRPTTERRRRLISAFAGQGPSSQQNRPRRPLASALTH